MNARDFFSGVFLSIYTIYLFRTAKISVPNCSINRGKNRGRISIASTAREYPLAIFRIFRSPQGAMVPTSARWRLTDISFTPIRRISKRSPRSFPPSDGISIKSPSGSMQGAPPIRRIWRKSGKRHR